MLATQKLVPAAYRVAVIDHDPFFDKAVRQAALECKDEFISLKSQRSLTVLLNTHLDLLFISAELQYCFAYIRLLKKYTHTDIVVTSQSQDKYKIYKSIVAGAIGFVHKGHFEAGKFAQYLQLLKNGGTLFTKEVIRQLHIAPREPHSIQLSILSEREDEILQFFHAGFRPKEISSLLDISYQTVRTHQKNIYRKLGVSSMAEAISMLKSQ